MGDVHAYEINKSVIVADHQAIIESAIERLSTRGYNLSDCLSAAFIAEVAESGRSVAGPIATAIIVERVAR